MAASIDMPPCQCDNCGHICVSEELRAVRHSHIRLDFAPSDSRCVLPAGECRRCGALAYGMSTSDLVRKNMTVYDLLMTAPDDQVTRLRLAWKDAIEGRWKDAAHWLRNAALEGDSTWHDECAVLAVELDAKNK